MLRRIGIYIALWIVTVVQAAVYTPFTVPDPKTEGQDLYVSNPDALIADSDVVWLNSCAEKLDAATHVEMCIVAIESIGDEEAFDFAYELFQRWGIGRKGQNTGVLILFVEESHDIRIMTGVGIEGVLPDARCSQIIHDDMIPAFQAGDYGGGLCLGALRIYEICTDGDVPEELLSIRSVTNRGQYADEEEMTTGEIITILVVLLAVILLIFFMGWWSSVKRCPKCGKRNAHAVHERILTTATYSREGQGERTYRCLHCGNVFVLPFIIPKRSHTVYISGGGGGGGSSFSGGGSWGGGSTFGGGAGGRW